MEWHLDEWPLLLTGTVSGEVGISDSRQFDGLKRHWAVSGEVERLKWDHFNPFCFFVVTDDGLSFFRFSGKNFKICIFPSFKIFQR
ncbi:unnamed protein product [Gongylonema pulchrum]|uniref:WD_REPEATS_REGION domain-containing protein n=1 Tax=Gongylonema pulchrum TaxID=637853 RepID=A0A183EVW5_9BILA|nr:unnamed protein product [Gongylonema pulchrum]